MTKRAPSDPEMNCPQCEQRCAHGYCACVDDDCPLCEAIEQNGEPDCECGAAVCKHGICENYCGHDEGCADCRRRANLSQEAEEEFAYQRDVIGPMFGWTEEN